MKRVLVITVICLLLGVVTTVAVAWALSTAIPYPPYFSGRADAGLTVGEGAGWYVRREERPGVRCEIGWPVSDVDDFLGEKTRDELGALAFVVDVRDWARAFATAPDSDATAPMLRIEDSRRGPPSAI